MREHPLERRRGRGYLWIGGALIVAWVTLSGPAASATPWRPVSAEEELERLPRPADDARAALRRLLPTIRTTWS
jgi:hypothetical protein